MIDLPPALLIGWAALLGAVVGSFLNVVIARLPAGESVVRPRSRCPSCGAQIAWYDNVPVVSWLLLRARCRRCGVRISWRYPLVELLGALAGALAAARHGLGPQAGAELLLVAVLLALSFIDLDTWLLPHALTWPLMVSGQVAAALGWTAIAPREAALGLVVGVGAFVAVAEVGRVVFRREALGYGDVWLLGGLGAWLGVRALLPVVLLASLQGAVAGAVALLLGRGEPGPTPPAADGEARPEGTGEASEPAPAPSAEAATPAATGGGEEDGWIPPRHAVPFGPFLALGALEWLYLAEALVRAVPPLRPFL